jgi:hypothetical protein
MVLLLSLMPTIAWMLLLLVLLISFSYLYVHHKNWGKVAMCSMLILILIGLTSWRYHTAEYSPKTTGVAHSLS